MFLNPKIPIQFSRMELDRTVLTTTFDTYKELKMKYPEKEFYFLIGSDIVGDIETKWENGRELARSANFLVFNRYGYNRPENLSANFICLDKKIVGLDLSSTFIRSLLLRGHSRLPYLTSAVSEYIKQNKLYN
ncbi:MAG: hypothetical protein A3I24_00800 [Candidatus Harrisonbacteria bacterium RIFCSPLOWO2_02_FULL_41_13b]|uniref:Nicotinate (Nicotinamide) nucleotide adenylyltransferase n=1 Tax=Candidatus Harrisonbacteria bacterium RIFCSPLOWO2_02_FULL_41_13b TaxID=1798409 RepID=A0A1G1ZTW3_9BACT|nr:MAG: hypothetical protein A3J53_00050 [Candidatus Harrisonbacteria bacterium RIFCSPHIGHO2_02_FULL_40_20]OGY68158.1 MAG: hypothetical protein A3I24_00800 [Candidatus Harrisonbacteria bacterium RIFCSPLOWO2_02_FULL_41_13b]